MKLSYFDAAGKAEPIRLAFVIAGMEFEDHRVKFEDWPPIKPSTPFGTMPVLEKDGQKIGQSQSILRYVGITTGLYPIESHWSAAKVDDIMSFVSEDLTGALNATFRMKEPEKSEKRAELFSGPMLDNLAILDKVIGANGDSEYCVGTAMTIADLLVSCTVAMTKGGFIDGLPTDICDPYTNLIQCHAKVTSHPKVAEYLANK